MSSYRHKTMDGEPQKSKSTRSNLSVDAQSFMPESYMKLTAGAADGWTGPALGDPSMPIVQLPSSHPGSFGTVVSGPSVQDDSTSSYNGVFYQHDIPRAYSEWNCPGRPVKLVHNSMISAPYPGAVINVLPATPPSPYYQDIYRPCPAPQQYVHSYSPAAPVAGQYINVYGANASSQAMPTEGVRVWDGSQWVSQGWTVSDGGLRVERRPSVVQIDPVTGLVTTPAHKSSGCHKREKKRVILDSNQISVGIQYESESQRLSSESTETRRNKDRNSRPHKTIICKDCEVQTDFSNEIADLTLENRPSPLYRGGRAVGGGDHSSTAEDSDEVDSDSGYSQSPYRRFPDPSGNNPQFHHLYHEYNIGSQRYPGRNFMNTNQFLLHPGGEVNVQPYHVERPCPTIGVQQPSVQTMSTITSIGQPTFGDGRMYELHPVSVDASAGVNRSVQFMQPVPHQGWSNAQAFDRPNVIQRPMLDPTRRLNWKGETIAMRPERLRCLDQKSGGGGSKRNKKKSQKDTSSSTAAGSQKIISARQPCTDLVVNTTRAALDSMSMSDEFNQLLSAAGGLVSPTSEQPHFSVQYVNSMTSANVRQFYARMPDNAIIAMGRSYNDGSVQQHKNMKKKQKRLAQLSRAADEELAEISLTQQMLREMSTGRKRNARISTSSGQNLEEQAAGVSNSIVTENDRSLYTAEESDDETDEKHIHPDMVSLAVKENTGILLQDSDHDVSKASNPSKKPTALKMVILKEREEKERMRVGGVGGAILNIDDGLSYEFISSAAAPTTSRDSHSIQDTLSSSKASSLDRATPLTLDSSPISQNSPISFSPSSGGSPSSPSAMFSPDSSIRKSSVISRIHSRRFREYCNQVLSREIDECCTDLLQHLVKFQYQFNADGLGQRRTVLGIREVTKHLKVANKIKGVIISPNLERIESKGGLDEALNNVISMCQAQHVPFVFALGRRALGRACAKLVPVSVVGLFSVEGAEDKFLKLRRLTDKARDAYQEMVSNLELEIQQYPSDHGRQRHHSKTLFDGYTSAGAPSTASGVPGFGINGCLQSYPSLSRHCRTPSAGSAVSFSSSLLSEEPISEEYDSPETPPETGIAEDQVHDDRSLESDVQLGCISDKRVIGEYGNGSMQISSAISKGSDQQNDLIAVTRIDDNSSLDIEGTGNDWQLESVGTNVGQQLHGTDDITTNRAVKECVISKKNKMLRNKKISAGDAIDNMLNSAVTEGSDYDFPYDIGLVARPRSSSSLRSDITLKGNESDSPISELLFCTTRSADHSEYPTTDDGEVNESDSDDESNAGEEVGQDIVGKSAELGSRRNSIESSDDSDSRDYSCDIANIATHELPHASDPVAGSSDEINSGSSAFSDHFQETMSHTSSLLFETITSESTSSSSFLPHKPNESLEQHASDIASIAIKQLKQTTPVNSCAYMSY